ncbi:helix-turn-helix domain-containing protein [Streptomyces sp. NPDC004610]|uniref:helix-turn-helix domain-containing protein n=1 Tax=unclassified Streptomyces TaxID=2593676 RepID=UPI0033B56A2E
MRELVSQLAAVDLAAAESLKVIGLFDALVEGRAPLEALVRAAAAFVAAPAGLLHPDRRLAIRVDGDGTRTGGPADHAEIEARWPAHPFPDGGLVWVERPGPPSARELLLLERLAVAVRLSLDRLSGGLPDTAAAVAVLLDSGASDGARTRSARALGLPGTAPARVLLRPPGPRGAALPARTAIVPTPAGPVRATVAPPAVPLPDDGPVGVGTIAPVTALPPTLGGALAALRLASPWHPVQSADDLGLLASVEITLPLDRGLATAVARIARIAAEPWGPQTLHALTTTDSVRAAAALCGVHHSTLQARCEQISAATGYDTRGATGRVRLTLDLAAYRLVTTTFCHDETG